MIDAQTFRLDGRLALVTGSSAGIGLALARGLAQAGATVVLNGRNADTLAQAWMFEQYGASDPRSAVDPLIGEMIDLLRIMNAFLEDALGAFVAHIILDGKAKLKSEGKVLAPDFRKVSIPFWTAMPPRPSRN